MNKHLLPYDISNHPDLLRLAEEVNTTKSPRKLMRDNETLAVVMPVGTTLPAKKNRAKTKADYEAFKSAAGSWKDVDTDKLIENIYAARRRSNSRPPIKV
jgi:hypothetical protein